MSPIHSQFLVTFPLISYFSLTTIISAIAGDVDDDPTIKTMLQFSGYPSSETHHHSLSSLSVDAQSLQNQIDELATISDSPTPSVTRVLYTDKDVAARRYIKNLMGLAGLSIREDTIGNIFGRGI